MNSDDIPLVGAVLRSGARDRVLDSILLVGPLVILGFVVFGRNVVTTAITTLYILSFLGYVIYKYVHRGRTGERPP